jgi:hypothetical protein
MREFHAECVNFTLPRHSWLLSKAAFLGFFWYCQPGTDTARQRNINRIDSRNRDLRVLGLSAETKTNQQRL